MILLTLNLVQGISYGKENRSALNALERFFKISFETGRMQSHTGVGEYENQ